MALVGAGFPVLMFAQDDETRAGVDGARRATSRRASVAGAARRRGGRGARRAADARARTRRSSRCCSIQSFYRLANALSRRARLRSRPPAAPAQGHRDASDGARRSSTAACCSTTGFVEGRAVLLEGGRIAARRRRATIRACAARSDTTSQGGLLLPGFIDTPGQRRRRRAVQRRTRASRPSPRSARAHRRFGTTGFLPTLISDDLAVVARAIARGRREAIAAGVPGVLGIHIEGPFLNATRKGVARRRASSATSTSAASRC